MFYENIYDISVANTHTKLYRNMGYEICYKLLAFAAEFKKITSLVTQPSCENIWKLKPFRKFRISKRISKTSALIRTRGGEQYSFRKHLRK